MKNGFHRSSILARFLNSLHVADNAANCMGCNSVSIGLMVSIGSDDRQGGSCRPASMCIEMSIAYDKVSFTSLHKFCILDVEKVLLRMVLLLLLLLLPTLSAVFNVDRSRRRCRS